MAVRQREAGEWVSIDTYGKYPSWEWQAQGNGDGAERLRGRKIPKLFGRERDARRVPALGKDRKALYPLPIHSSNRGWSGPEDGGDVYMSPVHTCYFAEADPIGYMTELQGSASRGQEDPSQWLPWNDRKALAAQ